MLIRAAVAFASLSLAVAAPVATTSFPLALTKYGAVQGFVYQLEDGTNNTANIFLGIPYAKPPLEELRFEKPELPEAFTEPLNATQFPPACASYSSAPGSEVALTTSEDCLYLNVFAPSEKSPYEPEGYPVLVWIHGGGFSSGSTEMYGYQALASNFISRGIIIVTVQYRLGMFGFFSTGDSEMPGNLGLWDQRAALLWIRDNIRAFGGNPNRITLWGQQSGAAAVSALTLSRHTRDLFQQAIEMSGSAYAGWAMSESVVGASKKIAEELRCPLEPSEDTKLCLKEKSTEEIAAAGMKKGWRRDDVNFLRMQMRLDGDFFDKPLDELLAEAPPKPTIQGITRQEAMLETLPFPSTPHDSGLVVPPEKLSTFSRDQLVRFVNETIAPESVFGEKTDEVRARLTWFYADRNASENADARFYLTRYTQILSDAQFAIPVLTEVRKKSDENWPVHLYLLNYMNPVFKLPVLGTYQTYELPYLFGISVVAPFELDDNDRKLRQVMVSAITNFVHTGNPSSPFGPWPSVTEEHPLGFFDMRPEPVLRDNLMLDRFLFWKNLTDSYDFDIVRGAWKSMGKPKNGF